ncbi:MAG: 2-oxo acid dehydrogenase subunit E2 [Planctomycetota bacterium]
MHVLRLPQAAKTMTEGTVEQWHVAEGDKVKTGQSLAHVRAADAEVTLQAGCKGVLRAIVAPEGTVLPVGAPLAVVAGAKDDIDDAVAALRAELSGETPAQAPRKPTKAKDPAKAPEKGTAADTAQRHAKPQAPAQESPETAPDGAEAAAGNVTPVLMPQVGNTMEEGTIVAWRVAEGDTIEQGQVIFDVETDKATVEVEATDAGRLARIVAGEGDVVPVKEPVAYLADNDADVEAYIAAQGGAAASAETTAKPQAASQDETSAAQAKPLAASQEGPSVQAVAPQQPAPTTTGGRVKASPAARKLAAKRGVDLAAVGAGSGPGGRIVTEDVAAAAESGAAAVSAGPVRHELSKMRKAIGGALLKSKQTIPHFYATITVDADALYATYRRMKAEAAFKCTINDLVVRAAVRCMREFPQLRSRLEDGALVEYPSANIGIAVGTDEGLLVPVVRSADGMTLERLAGETRRVVEAARNGKLEGIGEGLMTVTNLGMFGVETFGAIINPPESAILAVGALREDVVVRDGALRPGRVMSMTISCDHRIVDGVVAAQVLARMKELLEAPDELTD